MAELGLLGMLTLCGFDLKQRTKLVRHAWPKQGLTAEDFVHAGWLELYQCYQGKPVFDGLDFIVSFYALEGRGTAACLLGIFKVAPSRPVSKDRVEANCPLAEEWRKNSKVFYPLGRVAGFESLEHRLVVDWGRATQAWAQKLTDKEVLEVMPAGRTLPVFKDYLEFTLTHRQLAALFENPEAHRDWQARLEAVGGIYLIQDETTGDLYVGSASGTRGLWGRWEQYAKDAHGGNRILMQKVIDPQWKDRLRFSLLQIVSKTMSRDEIIRREVMHKNKLGRRACCLNGN